MTKQQFLQLKQDLTELQALTTATFATDDGQFKGVYPEINFHDEAHRDRIAKLLAKVLSAKSDKVMLWLASQAQLDLDAARLELAKERDELTSMIG